MTYNHGSHDIINVHFGNLISRRMMEINNQNSKIVRELKSIMPTGLQEWTIMTIKFQLRITIKHIDRT